MARKRKKILVTERKLGREQAWGLAYKDEKRIELEKAMRGKKRMKTLVHEALHQVFPEASESRILKAGIIIGNILWEQSYRRVDNKNF